MYRVKQIESELRAEENEKLIEKSKIRWLMMMNGTRRVSVCVCVACK